VVSTTFHRPSSNARRTICVPRRFRFGLLDRFTKADGSETDLCSACDALALKALTIVLALVLPVSPLLHPRQGQSGAKAAVRQVSAVLARTASC
jgi:hypothetical protein